MATLESSFFTKFNGLKGTTEMLRWFRDCAPIYRKLSIVFGVQAGMLGICCVSQILAYEGILPLLASAGLCACITLFALVTGLVLREAIAGPYLATVERMEALAAGDTEKPICFTGNTDCVGRMAKAMFTIRKAASDKTALDETAAQLEAHALRHAAEESALTLATTRHVVHALATGLIKFANGDLSWKITKWFGVEFKTLRMDFNQASENMEATMRRVIASTRTVESGANEIHESSANLASQIKRQAEQVEETASSLNTITVTVRQASEIAKAAAALAAAARADATASSSAVSDTMSAMAGVETSSQRIANIIGVIDEIAFQTNLLALNAGVEAVRAGDAGRGFAVVAAEVRALAKRSADAAKAIKVIISVSGEQVGGGVKLVNETGQALLRITGQISRLTESVGAIAAAAERQASELNKVNAAVGQIGQMTHENARMVEQSAVAGNNLSIEAMCLSGLMNEFKLTDPSTPVQAYEDGPPVTWQTATRIKQYAEAGIAALGVPELG